MKYLKIVGLILLILLVVFVVSYIYRFVTLGQESQSMNIEMYSEESRMLDCPVSPNCVNSLTGQGVHQIEAIQGGIPEFEKLERILSENPSIEILISESTYLYATHTSSLFGFVDDMEFQLLSEEIALRSASRVGHSDLGANRKRIEEIRKESLED